MRRAAAALVVLLALVASAVPAAAEDAAWYQREAANFARTRQESNRELTDPAFQQRLLEQSLANELAYLQFQAEHHFVNAANLCSRWELTCAGDPFRYPGVDPFYDTVGRVTEVLFYDRDCARISGRIWAPKDAAPGAKLPGVVITNGSVQAPETTYWWFAQALVRQGYVVMTWDPRGQGRSDTMTPDGQQGSNANSAVFWNGTVDAIDLLHSTAKQPYPHNARCQASVPDLYALPDATNVNPEARILDRNRLGLAGHSLGASAVARVQAMDPWEGQLDAENPVDVIVAWDSLPGSVEPRVPAMGQSSEYGLVNVPFTSTPDATGHLGGFEAWQEAGVPVSQFTIKGSTHYEWSLIPTTPVVNFSATSWVSWGNPMAEHYSVAWMDRWLKKKGEKGFADADARLLADGPYCDRLSFYFTSARDYPKRNGRPVDVPDLAAACA